MGFDDFASTGSRLVEVNAVFLPFLNVVEEYVSKFNGRDEYQSGKGIRVELEIAILVFGDRIADDLFPARDVVKGQILKDFGVQNAMSQLVSQAESIPVGARAIDKIVNADRLQVARNERHGVVSILQSGHGNDVHLQLNVNDLLDGNGDCPLEMVSCQESFRTLAQIVIAKEGSPE
ncbi:MAG TPA: hypothetical protein VMY42_06840 [Thermoguttaceae bacterium]|nr:hypothetical protein [Thermoguttaceae bacterium]